MGRHDFIANLLIYLQDTGGNQEDDDIVLTGDEDEKKVTTSTPGKRGRVPRLSDFESPPVKKEVLA
jgi:hypothetical protein